MATLKTLLEARNRGLLALDLEWCRNELYPVGGADKSDEFLLTVMHKARVECVLLPEDARQASATWLREHGHTTLGGGLPDPANLPV